MWKRQLAFALLIVVSSVVGDIAFERLTTFPDSNINPGTAQILELAIYVAYYLLLALFIGELFLENRGHIGVYISLFSFGMLVIWIANYPNPDFLLPVQSLFLNFQKVLTSRLALTIHSAALFVAVGALGWLRNTRSRSI